MCHGGLDNFLSWVCIAVFGCGCGCGFSFGFGLIIGHSFSCIGSIMWVANGFFIWLPLVMNQEPNDLAVGITALMGGTFFEVGAYLAVLEALNVGKEVQFAYAVEELIEKGIHIIGGD